MDSLPALFVPPAHRGLGYRIRQTWRNFWGLFPLIGLPAAGVVFSLVPALVAPDGWGMRVTQFWLRYWSRTLLWAFGVRVWVRGAEHLEPRRSFVLVSNHRSLLDVPTLAASVRWPLTVIYKRSLKWVPFIGQGLMLGRGVPVDRSNATQAKRSVAECKQRMGTGRNVVVFAEGTRSRGPTLSPFKKGAVVTAVEQQCELLPVTISGTDALYPPGTLMIHRGDILVTIHPPIPTAGTTLAQRDELNRRLQDVISGDFVAGPVDPSRLAGAQRVV